MRLSPTLLFTLVVTVPTLSGSAQDGDVKEPALPMLLEQLGSPRQATRDLAVRALVLIGKPSVKPLRQRLGSSSGRTRAAVIEALSRLRQFDVDELVRMPRSADPRVRAAIASALARRGGAGVPKLAAYLNDTDLAVAIVAARGLKSNRSDPGAAIPKLTAALSRKHLAWAAADALAAYGVKSRRAVPVLIQNYPLGMAGRFGWEDAVEEAIKHIGPPDPVDLPAMIGCLSHEHEEARILAAQSLASMGTKGRSAAEALEAAALAAVKDHVKQEKAEEGDGPQVDAPSGRPLVAAEFMAAAVWHVTGDAERFVRVLEKIVRIGGSSIRFSHPSPWLGFSAADCRSLKKLLRSSHAELEFTALDAVAALGEKAVSLKAEVARLASAQFDNSRKAVEAFAAMGPAAGEDAEPVILAAWRNRTMPLIEFASAVQRLRIRSKRILDILKKGLGDSDQWTVAACAKSLCATAEPGDAVYEAIITAANSNRLTHRQAIEALRQLERSNSDVVRYLIQQMSSTDFWTRHRAIVSLADLGKHARSALPAVKRQLNAKAVELRLQAALALFQISGDATEAKRQLSSIFAGNVAGEKYKAIQAVRELGREGAPWVSLMVAGMRDTPVHLQIETIRTLKAIGNKQASAALKEVAKSDDWSVKSAANAALGELSRSGSKEK